MDRSTARSLIYKMLSLWYVYPDEKVYALIAKAEWIKGFREALNLLEIKMYDENRGAIEKAVSGTEEGEQLAMAREYTRLFTHALSHRIAAPYGSIYLEKERLVSAKTTSEVLCFYHEAGFTLREDLESAPLDHIAHELEFMGILAGEASRASGQEKVQLEEIQMNFLSRFILPWVPAYCEKVAEHSRYLLYRHLSHLTKEFITFDNNYLGVPEELSHLKDNPSEIAQS